VSAQRLASCCVDRLNRSIFFRDLFAVPRPATNKTTAPASTLDQSDPPQGQLDTKGLSPTSSQALTLDEEIDIEVPSADLTLFADLLHFTVRFSRFGLNNHLQVSLAQAAVLLQLADKFDCPSMRNILRQTVTQKSRTVPWEVLVLACNRNDLDMARVAISNLSEKLLHDNTKQGSQRIFWDNLSKLRGSWQLEFLRLWIPSTARFQPKSSYHDATMGELNMNFATWAGEFDPKE